MHGWTPGPGAEPQTPASPKGLSQERHRHLGVAELEAGARTSSEQVTPELGVQGRREIARKDSVPGRGNIKHRGGEAAEFAVFIWGTARTGGGCGKHGGKSCQADELFEGRDCVLLWDGPSQLVILVCCRMWSEESSSGRDGGSGRDKMLWVGTDLLGLGGQSYSPTSRDGELGPLCPMLC